MTFLKRVDQEKLNMIYDSLEKPMVKKLLSKMELKGIKIDPSYLKKLSKKV